MPATAAPPQKPYFSRSKTRAPALAAVQAAARPAAPPPTTRTSVLKFCLGRLSLTRAISFVVSMRSPATWHPVGGSQPKLSNHRDRLHASGRDPENSDKSIVVGRRLWVIRAVVWPTNKTRP